MGESEPDGWSVDNNNGGRTGRECLIVCLWGYASYLNDHSTLAHHDRGRIHPTTIVSGYSALPTAAIPNDPSGLESEYIFQVGNKAKANGVISYDYEDGV
jgi:hypothetical protein